MKILLYFFGGVPRCVRLAVFSCLLAGFVVATQAQPYNLTNKNSTLAIDVSSGPGNIFNWVVDGANQLSSHWLYYRIGGSGPEYPLQNLDGTPTINSYINIPSLSKLDVTYSDSLYSVRTVYQLMGQNLGTGRSTISESITVQNNSSNAITFHLFQYSDFNLMNTAGGQSAQFFLNDVTGQYYKMVQFLGGATVTQTVTSVTPPISHWEATVGGATLGTLTDGNPTTLGDNLSAGPGDVAIAYQWDVVLAPGTSFQIGSLISVVPEPSTVALLSLGVAALGILRRRRAG